MQHSYQHQREREDQQQRRNQQHYQQPHSYHQTQPEYYRHSVQPIQHSLHSLEVRVPPRHTTVSYSHASPSPSPSPSPRHHNQIPQTYQIATSPYYTSPTGHHVPHIYSPPTPTMSAAGRHYLPTPPPADTAASPIAPLSPSSSRALASPSPPVATYAIATERHAARDHNPYAESHPSITAAQTSTLYVQPVNARKDLDADDNEGDSDDDDDYTDDEESISTSMIKARKPQSSPTKSATPSPRSSSSATSPFAIVFFLSLVFTLIFNLLARPLRSLPSFSNKILVHLRYYWRYYPPFRRQRNQPLYTAIFNRPTLAFILTFFLLIYLFAFISSCRSMTGCRAWPFAPPPPRENVPFTIISLLRDMSEESLAKDRSQFVIQWNALISWSMVVPPSQILIYMDTAGSCRKIMAQPELLGMTCLVVPCWHEEHKRPLLDCIFRVAHEHATTEIIAYVNGDILLHSDAQLLVNQVSSWFKDFLIVSRRTDTLVPQRVLDEFATKSSYDQVRELLDLSITDGQMHSEFGIDLFCYPKRLFDDLNFPPYLAGVYRWDNWLLSELILRDHVAVIDATRQGLVVHQEMGKVGHHGRTGAAWNDAIAKGRSGLKYKIGNIKNTDYVIQYDRAPFASSTNDANAIIAQQTDDLRFRLVANHNASIEVLIAKRVNSNNWVAVIPVTHFDLDHGHLNNWLCWAARLNFTHYIFLAEDRYSGRILHQRGLPVLQFDDAYERSFGDSTIHGGRDEKDGNYTSTRARRTSVDNFDFLMFKLEFLSMVLRAGYHFLYTHLNTIWLEDPLRYLHEGRRLPFGIKSWSEYESLRDENLSTGHDFDVAAVGNQTYVEEGILAVRATQWGQYMWKQIYLCEESNGAKLYTQTLKSSAGLATPPPTKPSKTPPKDPHAVVDCLNDVLKKHRTKVRRQLLPALLFPNYEQYFIDQSTQLLGTMPVLIQDDQVMTLANSMPTTSELVRLQRGGIHPLDAASYEFYAARIRTYKRNQIKRWKEWQLLAIQIPNQPNEPVQDVSPAASSIIASLASLSFLSGSSPIPSTSASSPSASPWPSSSSRPRFPCLPISSNPLLSPPVSKAQWDDYHRRLAAGQVNPTDPSPLDFSFKIRILTFDRPRSLARLLDSLNQVIWDADDRIALEVSIDYPRDMDDEESVHNWRLVATICDSFTWKYGQYSVIHQQQNIGLTGQWTWGWNKPDVKSKEIILFLEDDTSLVPLSWRWMKKVIQQYYLNPYNYDPNLYGFSLQSQHTVLGESKQYRYGSRPVHNLMSHDTFYYRYQLLGTWGTVFFPEHWMVFTSWLKSRAFQHTQGTSAIGFKPCVPTLLSNSWWQANPKRVWSQWMVRFAFEKGWYSLYTNFRNQSSMVVNFREGGLNFKVARGPMNPPIEELPDEYMDLPPLASTPLFDFHFRDWRHQPNHLQYHYAIMGATIPKYKARIKPTAPISTSPSTPTFISPSGMFRDDCYVFNQMKNVLKMKENTTKSLSAHDAALGTKYRSFLTDQHRLLTRRQAGLPDEDEPDKLITEEIGFNSTSVNHAADSVLSHEDDFTAATTKSANSKVIPPSKDSTAKDEKPNPSKSDKKTPSIATKSDPKKPVDPKPLKSDSKSNPHSSDKPKSDGKISNGSEKADKKNSAATADKNKSGDANKRGSEQKKATTTNKAVDEKKM